MATAVDSDIASQAAPGVDGGTPGPSGWHDPNSPDRESRRVDAGTAVVVLVDVVATLCAFGLAGGSGAGALVFLTAAVTLDVVGRQSARRLAPSALDEAPRLLARGIILTAIIAAVGLVAHGGAVWVFPPMAGAVVVAALYATVATLGRGLAYGLIGRAKAHGRLARKAVIVGTRPVGAKIAQEMANHPEHGLHPVGFVDVAPPAHPERLSAPMLGHLADLPKLVAEHQIDEVVVTFGQMRDDEMVEVLRSCDRLDCEIHVVPRLFELGIDQSAGLDHVWGTQLLRLRRAPFRTFQWPLKRVFDLIVGTLALALAAPVMAVCALALRVELGPGVLFRQPRVGLDGRPFVMLKFRTLKPLVEGEATAWSDVETHRMGPVGRFLRRSSLDELPQLWNVLRGQMSLVGPRPEQPLYVAQFGRRHHGYLARLRVRAGVTGLAQIHDLRGDSSIQDRVQFDNLYIEHWSLWQDVKIIVRTVLCVLFMRGG